MTLALTNTMTIKPEDFDPPLKRKDAAVPGYWTVEEMAEELGVSTRYIHYLIKGNPKRRMYPQLRAYNAGTNLLVADADALSYIQKTRSRNKS